MNVRGSEGTHDDFCGSAKGFGKIQTSAIAAHGAGGKPAVIDEVLSCGSSAAGCRVAGRGHPRPAPSEPCMGLSIHTAQASAKASRDTRFHNGIFGRLMISTAIGMVYLKITRCVRSAFGSFHDTTNTPRDARRDGFLTVRTQAVLPEPDAVQLRTAF